MISLLQSDDFRLSGSIFFQNEYQKNLFFIENLGDCVAFVVQGLKALFYLDMLDCDINGARGF